MSNVKAKKDIKYVGVDDGHSGTKIFAGFDINNTPIQKIIPSIVKQGKPDYATADQKQLDDATIFVGDEQFVVGSQYAGSGDDLVADSYPLSGQNVALVTQALRDFLPNWGRKPVELSIVTGLPLGHYFDKVLETPNSELIEQKRKNIARIESAYSPADNNVPMFELASNRVQPEGWGSVLDDIFTEKADPTERYDIVKEYGAVVIDIGGRTVDTMVVLAQAMTPKYKDVHTYDLGILFMHRDLRDTIMQLEKTNQPIPRERLEQTIQTGKYGRGKNQRDYSELVKKTLDSHAQAIFNQIKSVIGRPEVEGGVLITGGGAELLGSRLQELIEDYNEKADVFIPVDPVYSNARGFWKTAKLTAKKSDTSS